MPILYTLLIGIFTIFLEGFLVALGNLRFFFLLNLALFNKINWKYLLILVVLGSVVLDVIYHYVLGTNLLITGISLLLMLGISLLVPLEYNLPGYSVKFFCIFIYYLLLAFVPELISTGNWANITGLMVGGMVLKAGISIAFCVVFDLIWSRLRKRDEGMKLRSL